MAKLLSSEGIQSGLIVKPQHISQYVSAFNGSEAYGITISGSLTLSGSLFLHSNTSAPSSQDYILAYNNNTGKISKTPTTIIKDQAQSLFTHGTSNGIITTVDNASDTITISHGNTSNVVDINNSDGNVIQNIGLDSYGHITSSNSTNLDTRYLRNITINGVTSTSKTSDGSINLFGGEGIVLTSGTNGIVITSTIASSGDGGDGGGSNENFYLNNIQRLNNSNQLTFIVEGAPNQTFEFGSNAYTSTTIPTDTGDLTNGANFTTVSQIPTDENIRDLAQNLFTNGTSGGIITNISDTNNTITITHANTSDQADVNNSDGTVIQDIFLDAYGHVNQINSANLDTRYMQNWKLAINDGVINTVGNAEQINLVQGNNVTISSDTNSNTITIEATDTNNYLSNILKSGNSLNFIMNGNSISNPTFLFGANAFTSTTIPTDTGDLTNGANFATVSQVPTDENIRDLAQGLFSNGTSDGITTTVNDINNTIAITHANTSDQADVNNSDGTVIQDIFLDAYGHVNQINSANLDTRYMQNWKLAINDGVINTVGNAEQINLVQGNNVTISSDITSPNTVTIEATNTDTNFYLNGITQNNNTLTFIVNGTPNDQTFTFGSNAFTSTTIPTDTGDLTNGANFITTAGVTNGSGISTSVNSNTNTVSISHANTSDQADVNNSDGTVIQDIFLDTYGHVNQINSANLDNRYLRNDQDTSTNYIITANDFQLSSDKNLKENIKPINKSIDVDWVEYNFKDKPEEKRYGVIAQDLEKKHPEFINDSENGKTVSYIDLLVAKISELENRIKTLENASK